MKYSMDDIKGKVCVITGGSGIIGRALAFGLAEAEAKVAVIGTKKEKAEAVVQEINNKYPNSAIAVISNVLDKEALINAKKEINEKLGVIDVLVNCAGGNNPAATTQAEFLTNDDINDLSKGFFGLELDGFRQVFDLNFLGTVLPTMIFANDMVGRGGSIINISSMSSYRPITRVVAYSAAKSAVNNLTEWLAVHLAKLNIRVNAIAPGFFLTEQNRFLLLDKETNQLTERGKKIIAHTPMGRFGEPDEIVGTLLYLISDISKFVTGVVIPVDGGFNAFCGV
ncbi:MAG: SDR family oxidoreductase [Melioribacter sp.]|uniref:SDR family oxidoreductase n=1 Tax=Rosettibacter primus TaxID=3111523 RepID=UPI00247D1405|nr:SDR family oxidoreductase [Melioribacter sp.]